MSHKIKGGLAGMLVFFGLLNSYGQATQSPFTAVGIGDIIEVNLAHNQGTAGLGISNGSYWHLNNNNPALLPYNSLTVFSAGFIGVNQTIKSNSLSKTSNGGNLNYLVTAFPVKPGRWTTSIGLMPYSNVDYNFEYTSTVIGSTDLVTIREEGSGGFNQFYWSNGVAINKRWFVGLRATYLFSAIEKKFSNTIQNIGNSYTPVVSERISVSDFIFTGGLAFNQDSIFNSRIMLKAGLTYDFGGDVNAKQLQTFDRTINNRPPISSDTLVNNVSGALTLPQAIGFGVSLNRGLKWMVGMDVKMQQWADFKDLNDENNSLDNAFKISLGGEFTPDPTSVTSYFKRITFKIGGSYENTPYLIENNNTTSQVKDIGINFGWSLPVGRFSSFDMAFRLGKRGDVDNTIIEENYYKVYLGITFNDQWFIKRKYD